MRAVPVFPGGVRGEDLPDAGRRIHLGADRRPDKEDVGRRRLRGVGLLDGEHRCPMGVIRPDREDVMTGTVRNYCGDEGLRSTDGCSRLGRW